MKSNRINATFTIDKGVWELAKVLLPCDRSKFIERAIVNYINSIDDIDQLKREIEDDEQALAIKKHKLSEMERVRDENTKNAEKISNAMQTAFKIVLNHGAISESQIKDIANINLIDDRFLRKKIVEQGFKITKYTQEEHETTLKKVKI